MENKEEKKLIKAILNPSSYTRKTINKFNSIINKLDVSELLEIAEKTGIRELSEFIIYNHITQ